MILAMHFLGPDPWDRACENDQSGIKIPIDLALLD
jgi:hypothetical protein